MTPRPVYTNKAEWLRWQASKGYHQTTLEELTARRDLSGLPVEEPDWPENAPRPMTQKDAYRSLVNPKAAQSLAWRKALHPASMAECYPEDWTRADGLPLPVEFGTSVCRTAAEQSIPLIADYAPRTVYFRHIGWGAQLWPEQWRIVQGIAQRRADTMNAAMEWRSPGIAHLPERDDV